MTQALGELRPPVPHDALRLRMVSLHGREDPLLDAARFQRFLRQANDAEVADVRKLGDDEYEVSPHRTGGAPGPAAPAREAPPAAPAAPSLESAVAEAGEAAARENGQRYGVRFRRGSRSRLRPGEIPLIGVVQMETPEPAAATAVAEPEEAAAAPTPKKTSRRRSPRKKAAVTPAAAEAPAAGESTEAAAPRPRRPRARAKKKAE
jgi:hypothetical protein